MTAALVRDFVNTAEPQVAGEDLFTPERLRDWFAEHGLAPRSARFTAADVRTAVAFREGLRAVLLAHAGHDADPAAAAGLGTVLVGLPLRATLTGDGLRLTAAGPGALPRALAALVDAVRQSIEDGTWPRLKVCARDTCRWAFLDESRNQVRRWCSMAGCGNHVKMRRAYAARKLRGSHD
jgi:predicted RNA-binding Zn ribbon-like protein